MTHRSITAYREKQRRDLDAHLRSLGYESKIFKAKFKGGKCGLCNSTIGRDAEVAYFAEKLCHTPCVDQAIRERDNCKTCKGAHLVITETGIAHCPDCTKVVVA